MKKIATLHILFWMSLSIFAQSVHIFENKNKYGLKDENDKIILKASFEYMQPIGKNFIQLKKNGKFGVATKTGRILVPFVYDDIQDFEDYAFWVKVNDKWGIINQRNVPILPLEYKTYEKVTDYAYCVCDFTNKKGIVNTLGEITIPIKFDDISTFSKNLLLVKSGDKVGLSDTFGKSIIPSDYNSLRQLPNSHLYEVIKDSKFGLVDFYGKTLAQPIYDEIDYSKEKYLILKKDNKFGFLLYDKLVPATFDQIVFVQEELGVVVVKDGDLKGFITIYGSIVPAIYDNISRFSPEGFAFVEKQGKLMFVDITGRERTLQEVTGGR